MRSGSFRTSGTTRYVVSSHRGNNTPPVELCEHKGIGHPDSLCDGVAEAVSRALCRAYLQATGSIQHYNVDKALLIGGQSRPRFGGGAVTVRPRLIVCGRATALPDTDLAAFVRAAAEAYLRDTLRCDPGIFQVESAVRGSSPNLRRVVGTHGQRPRANDTSFGAGFAPYSRLERYVLRAGEVLRSERFHKAFPAAGDDYKVMGSRIGDQHSITVALAVVDKAIKSVKQYFAVKAAMAAYLSKVLDLGGSVVINALDDRRAADESGVYLTVTGLSAEHGDDGQVGRGNRVNGLITPGRPMSLEAAAGKNAAAHVVKLYNVLAHRIAHGLAETYPFLAAVTVQMLSTIGRPLDQPDVVAIRLINSGCRPMPSRLSVIHQAQSHLQRLEFLTQELATGRVPVF